MKYQLTVSNGFVSLCINATIDEEASAKSEAECRTLNIYC